MQIAAIAFARSVLQLKDANSAEFDNDCQYPIIHYMQEQRELLSKGGTMRLGAYPSTIKKGTQLERAYQKNHIAERHRHRFEFNNAYRASFEEHGMCISGVSPDDALVEAIEYSANDFYIGVQYHPEFKSSPHRAHRLFIDLIKYAKQLNKRNCE